MKSQPSKAKRVVVCNFEHQILFRFYWILIFLRVLCALCGELNLSPGLGPFFVMDLFGPRHGPGDYRFHLTN
jgi:hypothetical protein